jgi:pSer/pThr/pTyr-binding forkhead associated (FHA) protein
MRPVGHCVLKKSGRDAALWYDAPTRAMYRLSFQNGAGPKEPLVVRAPLLTFGRDPACQVQLHDAGVAGHHARIERRADGYYLRDLNSPTGVSVNGRLVRERRLASGDEIEIGSVQVRFEVVHDRTGGRRRRPLDLLQIAAAVVVAVVIGGEIVLLSRVFSETRPRKMNVEVKHGWRGQQAVIGAEPTPPAPTATSEPRLPIPPAAAASAPQPAVLHRMIRIVRVDRSDGAGAVTLTIQAKAQVGERELNVSAVGICVQFATFETGTTAVVWRDPVWLPIPAWENFASKAFTVRFSGAPRELAGFVVSSYYRNELQDVAAAPPSLRALAPSPKSEQAPNPVAGGAP